MLRSRRWINAILQPSSERRTKHQARLLFETPSNPVMTLTDLLLRCRDRKARHITTLIDNTFATPPNQRPLALGIDLVFHSATKYFGGHSDLIAGAIMGTAEWMLRDLEYARHVRRGFGASTPG